MADVVAGSGASRRKVAILGGGMGAMAAAFELTSQPGWRERYDVTVYQIGWRLGGKAASGRNVRMAHRIEEHGLHILFGFYENTFDLLRRCYAELNRPRGAPLRQWTDAFKPHDSVIWAEKLGERWSPWPVRFGKRPGLPGDGMTALRAGTKEPSIVDLLLICLEQNIRMFFGSRHGQPWWHRIWLLSRIVLALLGRSSRYEASSREADHLREARRQMERIERDDRADEKERFAEYAGGVCRQLDGTLASAQRRLRQDNEARRFLWQLQLGLILIKGLLADDVLFKGFDHLEDLELRDWFRGHGAPDDVLASPFLNAAYDLCFAFADGQTTRPAFAAGTALRNALRAYDYRGAVMWKMQAGMGDTVFMPIYEVLHRRGVSFKFFHRVMRLHPSDGGKVIDSIDVERQVEIPTGEYDPRLDVAGLSCWPSEPMLDRIEHGDALVGRFGELETGQFSPPDAKQLTLVRGHDFDEIVLGISLGALPSICSELAVRDNRWKDMFHRVKTVSTQALQLWIDANLKQLGWHAKLRTPVLAGFIEPIDTWADMTHLIAREVWSSGVRPKSLAYFCGPLAEPDSPEPPETSEMALGRARKHAREFIEKSLPELWRLAVSPGFWDRLIDSNGGAGHERLESQYFRANTSGSERYVLSVPGSTCYRLRSDQSGFTNLHLAGDWTLNGLNSGCAESAVMSGKQAARSVLRTDPAADTIIVYGELDS